MDAIIAALEAASDAAAQRKAQAQAASAPAAAAANAAPAAPVAKKPPRAKAQPQRPPTVQHPPAPVASTAAQAPLQAMFEDGNTLLRAIVASEVLQPPLALRENAHWIEPANGL